MRRMLSVILALSLMLCLSACGGSEPESGAASAVPQEAEPLDPKEAAASSFRMISTSVEFAEDRMNDFVEHIAGLGTEYTAQDLHDFCETGIKNCMTYRDHLEDAPDQTNSEEYRDAAYSYIINVEAALIKMRDYLEDQNKEDLDYVSGCIELQNTYAITFAAAQQQYLMDAGFTSDEIADLLDG